MQAQSFNDMIKENITHNGEDILDTICNEILSNLQYGIGDTDITFDTHVETLKDGSISIYADPYNILNGEGNNVEYLINIKRVQ